MILLLDSSTPVCYATLVASNGDTKTYNWQSDRDLARGLLGFLHECLEKNNVSWNDLLGIGVFAGPGSYTGLRIGLTVLNTLADAQQIPIVGAKGESWQDEALSRLQLGENDQIVLPFYGGEANITTPRK